MHHVFERSSLSNMCGMEDVMRIEGTNRVMPSQQQESMEQATDTVSKNIQNQIAGKQQELQKLSDDQMMDQKEKMKKRQEIAQEIASLNTQLRQHLAELRREQRQKQTAEEVSPVKEEKELPDTGFGKASMKAMISADTSIQQAQEKQQTAAKMERKVAVLEAEIRQDAGRGRSTEGKKQEVEDIQQRVENISTSQTGILKDAQKEIRDARKIDREGSKRAADEKAVRQKVERYKEKPYESVKVYF